MISRKPTHPGVVLLEDVIKPLGLTITDAARMLGVSRKALSEFVNEKAMLSPDMAIRIAKATNTSPESWMNMQQKLTLWEAEQHLPKNDIPFPSVRSEEAAALPDVKMDHHIDGAPIEPKCEVSHWIFRDWPHMFYIYKQVSKFCDCIKIYIFHFGYLGDIS